MHGETGSFLVVTISSYKNDTFAYTYDLDIFDMVMCLGKEEASLSGAKDESL